MKPSFAKSKIALQDTTRRFIGDSRRSARLLDNDINFEEERTGIFDPANSGYSVTARQLRARRENLAATISNWKSALAPRH